VVLLLSAAMCAPVAAEPNVAPPRAAVVYYVRPDGGSAAQCTGRADAPYPGAGENQLCAWDHPFQALPPGGPPRIEGGDTLHIGAGSYRMGVDAPGAAACSRDWPWDCVMVAVPSGPEASQRTRILGAGWDSGCTAAPELWGAERAGSVLNLTDASHVEVACLEITDHAGCVEFHSGGLACERDAYPFGDWAATGLYAEDSVDVLLRDLNIHGLANAGVWAGRLTDWTVENVRVVGNGWVGWNGDLAGEDSNEGDLTFRRWTVAWNGCAETWPGEEAAGCWAQEAGGYGDGVGTGFTRGHWVIEDSAFLHNTSDGLDLLYAVSGATIEVRRTRAAGNAGNQIKTAGPAILENNIVVGNCGYFDGRPITYLVDHCRAAGNALSLSVRPGDQVRVVNNTVTGEGDCLVLGGCVDGNCDGSEAFTLRNNLFVGAADFLQPEELTCLLWAEGLPGNPFDADYNLVSGVKDEACPGAHDLCNVSPGLVNPALDAFDAHLLPTSPAIDAGAAIGAPATDFDNLPRILPPDLGAFEWRTRRTIYLVTISSLLPGIIPPVSPGRDGGRALRPIPSHRSLTIDLSAMEKHHAPVQHSFP